MARVHCVWVCHNRYAQTERAHGAPPVSTVVSRSIGDWDGSRAIVPEPDVLRFDVPADGLVRVVIASDGVWDFVTPAQAAMVLRTSSSAQAAASRLVRVASRRSHSALGRLKDDTTALVIELNPSGLPLPVASSSQAAKIAHQLWRHTFGCCLPVATCEVGGEVGGDPTASGERASGSHAAADVAAPVSEHEMAVAIVRPAFERWPPASKPRLLDIEPGGFHSIAPVGGLGGSFKPIEAPRGGPPSRARSRTPEFA